ncbi:SRPBCC domain-containing protein [Acuticoccus sp. MNP-M23]|uniref:SRPBCC domain-containing protein n=1 Tax=Acuticoccus sp. MNP-M23 TaxID=3072793 RepID=UPI002815C879|nr:SRPBCC domain-containing protein [Acuticoccus sp. MNP-M23]WMS43628.1 SRPBCC domain-containing protein [Acuticoccus sp. MNP-M23]
MSEQSREGRDGPEMPAGRGYKMTGAGSTVVPVAPAELWAIIMDERRLAAAIPGAETLRRVDEGQGRAYAADVGIGVGRLKGIYRVSAVFADMAEPESLVLLGGAEGPFGRSSGEGWIDLAPVAGGTEVRYRYALLIKGMVAAAGGRLLDKAAATLIEKFFSRLARAVGEDGATPQP